MEKTSKFGRKVSLEVLCQLFFDGPCFDGNLASKTGRDILVDLGLAERGHGFQWLTKDGINAACSLGFLDWKAGPRVSAYDAWQMFCSRNDPESEVWNNSLR